MKELLDLVTKVAEEAKDYVMWGEVALPVEVEDIRWMGKFFDEHPTCPTGTFVSIRPCAEEYANKTYLGIMIGDIAAQHSVFYNPKTKRVSVYVGSNPAIFVPDLNKVIFGYESWWGPIESPEHLRKITNDDIQNIWYVKAMKTLGYEPTLHPEKEKEDAERSDGSGGQGHGEREAGSGASDGEGESQDVGAEPGDTPEGA